MTDIDDARALATAFREQGFGQNAYTIEAAIDEALGAVGGTILTDQDRALTIAALRDWHGGPDGFYHARIALAERLEGRA